MSKARSTMIVGGLVLLMIAIAAWFLLLAPRMGKPGEIRAQADQIAAQNDDTQVKIKDLEQKKKSLPEAEAYAAQLAKRFPATAAQGDLFDNVKSAAERSGIPERNIMAITPAAPAMASTGGAVTLPAPPAPTPAPAPAAGGTAKAPATGTPAAGTPAAAPAPVASLAAMQVELTVNGSKDQLIKFLNELEKMNRSYLVSGVTLAPANEKDGNTYSVQVTGSMFMLPAPVNPNAPAKTAPATASTTPATPAAPAASTPAS